MRFRNLVLRQTPRKNDTKGGPAGAAREVLMEVLALGLNHQSAARPLREALYFDSASMAAFLRSWLAASPREGIVGLSTCNRTEFYVATRRPDEARRRLLEALERAKSLDLSANAAAFYSYLDAEAAAHLCRVACGLDSLVVGEDQIMGQVRQAYHLALDVGAASGILNLLFERALRTARRARTETQIGQGNVSVASVAVSFIRKVFSNPSQHNVLLVGAGETAELVAQCLLEAGVRSLAVANRTAERATALAQRFGARTARFDDLAHAVAEADIVICATGSADPVLTAEMMKKAMARRGNRLLAALDISVPRNIDPAADDIPQLFVYDMEALEQVCEENRAKRRSEARKVEAIIQAEVERFVAWTASLDAEHVIGALRRRMEQIRLQELERYGGAFPASEKDKLDRFSASLLNKALHDLTVNIKSVNLDSEDGLLEFDVLCRALNLDPVGQGARDEGPLSDDSPPPTAEM